MYFYAKMWNKNNVYLPINPWTWFNEKQTRTDDDIVF